MDTALSYLLIITLLCFSTVGASQEADNRGPNTPQSVQQNLRLSGEPKVNQNQAPNVISTSHQDFRQSSNGILVHENCFEPGRWKFDIELAVTSSYAQGAKCLLDGGPVDDAMDASNRVNHELLKPLTDLQDPKNWKTEALPYSFSASGEKIVFSDCSLLRQSGFFAREIPGTCSVDNKLGNRPKVFCERDLSDKYRGTG